jgi:hypothetical protein
LSAYPARRLYPVPSTDIVVVDGTPGSGEERVASMMGGALWSSGVVAPPLLVLSAVVYACGFSAWMLVPTYAGLATGFVLSGLSSALMSGTFEALLYDELAARRAEAAYPRLIGWCHSTAMTANLAESLAAAPLFALGGYPLVGWASVAFALLQAVLAATLSTTRHPHRTLAVSAVAAAGSTATRYVAMLRVGLRESSSAVDVRSGVRRLRPGR